jgi:hypothetical protein
MLCDGAGPSLIRKDPRTIKAREGCSDSQLYPECSDVKNRLDIL